MKISNTTRFFKKVHKQILILTRLRDLTNVFYQTIENTLIFYFLPI
jgi:hypothetical protein